MKKLVEKQQRKQRSGVHGEFLTEHGQGHQRLQQHELDLFIDALDFRGAQGAKKHPLEDAGDGEQHHQRHVAENLEQGQPARHG